MKLRSCLELILSFTCTFTHGQSAFVAPPPLQTAKEQFSSNESSLHHRSVSTQSCRHDQLSTFQAFEESVLARISESQQHDGSLLSDTVSEAATVKWNAIQKMLQQNNRDRIQQVAQQMNDNGGFVIVELDDQSDCEILAKMWNTVYNLVFPDFSESSPLFRQQVLTRDTKESESSQSGYKYIETSIRRLDNALSIAGSNDDDSLESSLGARGAAVAAEAFQLLLTVASTVVYLSIAGSYGMDSNDKSLDERLNRMTDTGEARNDDLSDDDTPFSSTVHRLCRYATCTDNNDSTTEALMENIRSHTDWTLVTLVPVSNISGLELWNPSRGAWIRPEVTARKHWEAASEYSHTPSLWNSRYVVVMAGKWLEILTDGITPAAVHRVVATNNDARMSAPFFLRPRNRIATDVQKWFGAKSGDTFDNERHGSQSAVDILAHYLWQRYL